MVKTTVIENILHLVRVPYGKKDVPKKKREYRVREFKTTAVGTITEIVNLIVDKGLSINALSIHDPISSPEQEVMVVLDKEDMKRLRRERLLREVI